MRFAALRRAQLRVRTFYFHMPEFFMLIDALCSSAFHDARPFPTDATSHASVVVAHAVVLTTDLRRHTTK